MGKIATRWHSSTHVERVELLTRLSNIHFPIDAKLIEDTIENMDAVARDAGFVGIMLVAEIDDITTITPAIVSSQFSEYYSPRELRNRE